MRKRTRYFIAALMAVVLIAGIIPAVTAVAVEGSETQITTNTADQLDPAISGSLVVFTDARNGNKDIYLYDILSGIEADLTPGTPSDQYLEDIGGVNVVYTNVESGVSDIYLQDVSRWITTPLTAGGINFSPATEGDYVVWISQAGVTRNVLLGDVDDWTLTKITSDPPDLDCPRVSGDWVVWEEQVGSWRQIRAYQISIGLTKTLTTDESNHRRPDVSGNLVVYSGDADGNLDIYLYDLSSDTTTQITYDPTAQRFPRISGRRIVWEDDRGGFTQIYTTDLDVGLEQPVSPSTHPQILSAIDGNRVVWTEARYGNFDIFLFTIATCGDGTCNGAESCSSCPADCGTCPPVCGDATCDGDETCSSCPGDCGVCPPENTAPEITKIVNQIVFEGSTLSFVVSAEDAENDPLTFSAIDVPIGATFDQETHTFTWTPGYTQAGWYDVTFTVTDGSLTDEETVGIYVANVNRVPVAEAGPDQLIQTIGQIVIVNGEQSYDEDGDPLTAKWFLTSKPYGSSAGLYEWSGQWICYFIADKQGTYIVELVVKDPYSTSLPDSVTISFENIRPVADAGASRSIILGETVTLDGSGSYDLNGDPLSYSWSQIITPQGSMASIINPSAVITSITPDLEGTYSLQLIVNDGLIDSDPSIIQIEVIPRETDIISDLQALEDAINALDSSAFKNENMQNALINKINAIIAQVVNGEYTEALAKLQTDILPKTDGCALTGAPDNNDWIRNCEDQAVIYPLVLAIIEELQ